MLALVLSEINLGLVFIVFALFKTVTDNQYEVLIILRDEVIQLNKELQALRDDEK